MATPEFLKLSDKEKASLLQEAGSRLGIPAEVVEKDCWVTWTLAELFTMEGWGTAFAFKGGTSLSKCWGLIDRFSEDIDIVVDRAHLGFQGDQLSRNRIDRLRRECSDRVLQEVRPRLLERAWTVAPEGPWACEPEFGTGADRLLESLNLEYPGCLGAESGAAKPYMRRMVRIELGARSETWPASDVSFGTMLEKALPSVVATPVAKVRAVRPERTFLDKIMILHEEHHRPPGSAVARRHMARHFYDVHRLIQAGVAGDAVRGSRLFDSALAHRRLFFKNMARHVEDDPEREVSRGRLAAVPTADQDAQWREDYKSMREFFPGEPPSWDEVIGSIHSWQNWFNSTPWIESSE